MSDVPPHGSDRAGKAKLLLVVLSLAWGLSWPVMMVALAEVTPWTLRVLGYANGTLCMFALAKLRGRSARLPFGVVWGTRGRFRATHHRRLRPAQHVCPAQRADLPRRHRHLLDADLGEPAGVADSRRASQCDFLWFDIVGRLPAATASLGSLCVPVVGIVSSMVMLGERPTLADAIGFALILAAAACVLIAPSGRT